MASTEADARRRSISTFAIIKDIFHQIHLWFQAGDPPPRTQVKSIYLMIFMNIVGFCALTIWLLAYFRIKFYSTFVSIVPIGIVAFLMLCPGIYGAWVSFSCWRRRYGYDWFMIPHYD
jgi:hypothetical protein